MRPKLKTQYELIKEEVTELLPALFSALSTCHYGSQMEIPLGAHKAHKDIYGFVRIFDPKGETLAMASLHKWSDGSYRPSLEYVLNSEQRLLGMLSETKRALVLYELAAL